MSNDRPKRSMHPKFGGAARPSCGPVVRRRAEGSPGRKGLRIPVYPRTPTRVSCFATGTPTPRHHSVCTCAILAASEGRAS